MTDAALTPLEAPRRFRFDWIPAVLFRPRQAMQKIVSQTGSVWLTPLLVLTLTSLILVWASGSVRQKAAQMGQVELPPDFQYYSPEQQAQFQQAQAATSGPVFIYVFPAISALAKVWLGWLVVGGLFHLVLTLLGARGDTGSAMNLVAWASLPFGVRDLVRAVYTMSGSQLISRAGLSGFVTAGENGGLVFLAALLALVDIYLIWYVVLLILGVKAGNGLPGSKAITSVLITVGLILLAQAGIGYLMAQFGGLTVVRPFMF